MPVNSRRKGAAGERELAAFLRAHGIAARRGQQFRGGADSPDVVCDLPGVHIETKRTEALRLWEAIDQATREADENCMPTVWHRCSRRPWVVILDAEDFLALHRKAMEKSE
jgi:hypothetical protein